MRKNEFYNRLVKKYSITYHTSSLLFPAKIRAEVFVIYAFLRLADELVDNPESDPSIALESFRKKSWEIEASGANSDDFDYMELWKRWGGKSSELQSIADEIIINFWELARRRNFEKKWVEAFLNSMGRDLLEKDFENWDELNEYIFGSAEVVGLMMNRIMEVQGGESEAMALGWAMQMTNFIRDVKEDWARGRIYVPKSELERFGLSRAAWGGRADLNLILRDLIARTEKKYQEAEKGLALIPWRSRMAVAMAMEIYRGVLRKIAKRPELVWRKNFKKTLVMVPVAWVRAVVKSFG